MINVVYPLVKSNWEEIRFSLRSLEQHLNEDFEVHVIGDYFPSWMTNVNYIETVRKADPYADTGQKYQICCDLFENFVWMNDDIYLLKSTKLRHIKDQPIITSIPKTLSAWSKTLHESVKYLSEYGITNIKNFSTHTPYYYESEKLKQLEENFPIFDGKVSVEMVYFNLFGPENPRTLTEKLGIYSDRNARVTQEHRYLHHNDRGLTDKLKSYLEKRFGTPSRFEISDEPDITPIIKPIAREEDDVLVRYIGKKSNYVYSHYDFSKGTAYLPKDLAKYLVTNYPRTFSYFVG